MDHGRRPRPDACESCGEATELVLVRRVYLTIEPEPTTTPEGPAMDTGELEWWCEVCRIHYPHQQD